MKPRAQLIPVSLLLLFIAPSPIPGEVRPVVEAEEVVYQYEPADNGAGPMWCFGNTCIVRINGEVFVSGLEKVDDAEPLNNVRWTLHHRDKSGWRQVRKDREHRTREPCPIGAFPDGWLLLSVNPTLTGPGDYNGPSEPRVLSFRAERPAGPFERLTPVWDGTPRFTEHSYRSFLVDAANRELILFQNVGYSHAEWAFRNRGGEWVGQGELKWPWGAGYSDPRPIRLCYPVVQLKDRGVYFCGVSDIQEPNEAWRRYKRKITGRKWDYDFRRLFFTWSPDITTSGFREWVEIASREETAGRIRPCDLWVAPSGDVHVLWTEKAIDERLRERFFPEAKQSFALNYAVLRDGRVLLKKPVAIGGEKVGTGLRPGVGRFQVTPDHRLFIFYYVGGADAQGRSISENRVVEVRDDHTLSEPVTVPLEKPLSSFFTATVRAGSPPADRIDLLGPDGRTMRYVRIRLFSP